MSVVIRSFPQGEEKIDQGCKLQGAALLRSILDAKCWDAMRSNRQESGKGKTSRQLWLVFSRERPRSAPPQNIPAAESCYCQLNDVLDSSLARTTDTNHSPIQLSTAATCLHKKLRFA